MTKKEKLQAKLSELKEQILIIQTEENRLLRKFNKLTIEIKKMRAKIKGIICPVTIGKKIDCSACKYCITKNKVLFVQH